MGSVQSGEDYISRFARWHSFNPPCTMLYPGEVPAHRVRITKPFFLGAYPVTVGQFRKFVDDSRYKTDAEKGTGPDGKGAFGFDVSEGTDYKPEYSWRNPGFRQTDEHPVTCVSWNDAVAFCRWLNTKEVHVYRLPTEAEWEYACRAGTTTFYWFGDDPEGLAKIGNIADATMKAEGPAYLLKGIDAKDGYAFTSPVDAFPPNPFGLHDMHGNVCQWCADWYDKDYYRNSPTDDPPGPKTGRRRVLRNECFTAYPVSVRATHREGGEPKLRTFGSGFRIARSFHPKQTESGSSAIPHASRTELKEKAPRP